MTSGDEAGALTDSETRTVSDSGGAHDVPAPAEPDPGGADSGESASGDIASGEVASSEATSSEVASGDDDSGDDTSWDADSGEDAEVGPPASAGIWVASVTVLVAALIVGLVTAGIFWNRASGANATTSGKQAAEAAARTGVTDLLTADYQNPGAWSAKLKPLAAGQFLSVVGNSASGFNQILAQGKVQTTGQVVDVGVEKFNGTTAQLAVLADETVKNTQTPTGSERAYRMVISMVQSGSKWLLSNVEFVQ
jgi:Mce-associated membrane protein